MCDTHMIPTHVMFQICQPTYETLHYLKNSLNSNQPNVIVVTNPLNTPLDR